MSRILRRPMFRGGSVDSRGSGITSGLGYASGGRVGYQGGGQIGGGSIYGKPMGDRYGFAEPSDTPNPANSKEYRDYIEKQMYPSTLIGDTSRLIGNTSDLLYNYGLRPLGNIAKYAIGNQETIEPIDTVESNINKVLKSKGIDLNKVELSKTVQEEKEKDDKRKNEEIKKIMSEEKSDTEVMQEYMDMFSEAYGTDKEALNRSRFLEIAKFGANILAQPGGDSLGEVLGKAGAPALEGMSKIEESENQGQRQLKGLAIQAAIKKMDNPLLDNAKTISRYTGVPVAKVLERELQKGTGQLETNKSRYRESLAGALETQLQGKNIDLDKYSISDIMIEKGLKTKDVQFHSSPNETSEDLVVDQIYIFKKPSKGNYIGKWNGKGFDIIK